MYELTGNSKNREDVTSLQTSHIFTLHFSGKFRFSMFSEFGVINYSFPENKYSFSGVIIF